MRKLLAIAVLLSVSMMGCTSDWVKVALADLPIVINLVLQVTAMFDPGTQKDVQEYAQEAAVDLRLIQSLIDEYNAGNKTTKAATLGKITVALNETQQHLNAILSAIHVVNGVKARHIEEGVTLALVTVTTISQLIGQKKTTAALPSPAQLNAELVALR